MGIVQPLCRGIVSNLNTSLVYSSKAAASDFTLNFQQASMPAGVTSSRASAATITDITGANQVVASNVGRLDYHPITHAPRGLLIEPTRTNFLLNSGAPVTQTTGSLTTGLYTLWVVGTGSAAVAAGTATITGAGSAVAGTPVTFNVTVAGTVNVTVTGSLTRFQLEKGPDALTYIPTTAATATRASESASIPLGAWFNPVEGTLIMEVEIEGVLPVNANGKRFFQFDDGTDTNVISMTVGNGSTQTVLGIIIAAGATSSSSNGGVLTTPNEILKVGFAYKAANNAGAHKGAVLTGTMATAALPAVSLTTLRIGNAVAGNRAVTAWVRNIKVWKRRVSNAELQSMTT